MAGCSSLLHWPRAALPKRCERNDAGRCEQRMKRIRVYRNPNCARCAKFAKIARFFDWLGRLDHSTEAPRTGPLRIGEVVVEDLSSGRLFRGAEGIDMIWRHIPAYAPFRLLLRV